MRRISIILGFILVLASSSSVVAQDNTLNITWVESDECALFDRLTDNYAQATISVNCVPPEQWFDAIFIDIAGQSGADLFIMDTQFFGAATERNALLDLTDWYSANFDEDLFPSQVLDIHRTDELGLIAMPLQADVRLLAYRADLYQQVGFVAPTTWEELVAHAQVLQSSEIIPSGFATNWSRQADYVSSTWNHILWSYGGELWDETTYSVTDILNSEEALQALGISNSLLQTAPEDALTFTPDDVVTTICNGEIAIVEIWASDSHQIVTEDNCPESENIAFAVIPAGDEVQVTGYGGVGISINAFAENQELALDFLAWFCSQDVQENWLINGGMSARSDILNNESAQTVFPFIIPYANSLPLARDYWQIPEFPILLGIQQQYIQFAISGQLEVEEALDALVNAQQDVLDSRYGEDD